MFCYDFRHYKFLLLDVKSATATLVSFFLSNLLSSMSIVFVYSRLFLSFFLVAFSIFALSKNQNFMSFHCCIFCRDFRSLYVPQLQVCYFKCSLFGFSLSHHLSIYPCFLANAIARAPKSWFF